MKSKPNEAFPEFSENESGCFVPLVAIEIFKFENRTSDGEIFLAIGRDDSSNNDLNLPEHNFYLKCASLLPALTYFTCLIVSILVYPVPSVIYIGMLFVNFSQLDNSLGLSKLNATNSALYERAKRS